MPYVYGMDVSPEVIYIIRHAEKPLKPPLSGVDYQGSQNEHSLLPRGWQRSGALAALVHRTSARCGPACGRRPCWWLLRGGTR